MRILIGSTRFSGIDMAELAHRRGHTVTLFRGRTHPEIFPEVEKLEGDRDGKLDASRGRRWDAFIDARDFARFVLDSLEQDREHAIPGSWRSERGKPTDRGVSL